MNNGVISIGLKCPIIREGDNLRPIIVDSIMKSGVSIDDRDVFGITESIVARAEGNYVTVDDIAAETKRIFGDNAIIQLCFPIYSRNRFSMILKGIARGCKAIIMLTPSRDEVGNPWGVNPWTNVNISEYYKEIIESENCIYANVQRSKPDKTIMMEWLKNKKYLVCSLHNWQNIAKAFRDGQVATLADYFSTKCDYGLLGSNKANEEKLKLFPSTFYAKNLITGIQEDIKYLTGKDVEVMVYGDGCFKDADSGIWEFADPVVSPAYTDGLHGSPHEIKIKAFADDKYKNLNGKDLEEAIKKEILDKPDNEICHPGGDMATQGTTPRRFVVQLASLMDLTSGSGDRGTPIVLVKNYFKNYAD